MVSLQLRSSGHRVPHSAARRSQQRSSTLLLLARFACFCTVTSLGAFAAACGSATSTEAAAKKDVKSEYGESGRLTRLTYDRNGDGKIDTWGYMDGARVVRVEVDENGDGKIDRWEYHSDPKGSAGSTGSSGSDRTKPDGGPDASSGSTRYEIRRHGVAPGILRERRPDACRRRHRRRREDRQMGNLHRTAASPCMALDTKGRGTPDRRLIYRADGSFDRIETDPNGTGTWHPLHAVMATQVACAERALARRRPRRTGRPRVAAARHGFPRRAGRQRRRDATRCANRCRSA